MNPTAPKENRFTGMRAVMHSGISMPAKLVYYELDERSGYKGHCWPKQQTIATCLGISRRAVIDAVCELSLREFIRVERGGKFLTYFLRWADVHQVHRSDRSDVHEVHRWSERGAHLDAPSINEQHHEQRKKEQRCSFCGGSGFGGGTTGADLEICNCAAGDAIRRSA